MQESYFVSILLCGHGSDVHANGEFKVGTQTAWNLPFPPIKVIRLYILITKGRDNVADNKWLDIKILKRLLQVTVASKCNI